MRKKADTNARNHDPFLRLGGDPILDFCNTIVFHGDQCEDRLASKYELSRFLNETFDQEFVLTSEQFKSILKFRELLRAFLEEMIEKKGIAKTPPALNSWLSDIPLKIELQNGINEDQAFAKLVTLSSRHQSEAQLAVSFFTLLNNMTVERLKNCANPNCSHFYYDSSKSNTRNWCSMKSCGNIMKARAFYNRSKKE